MLADRLDHGTDGLHRGGHIERGPGQQTARVGGGTPQVDPVQHICESRRLPPLGTPRTHLLDGRPVAAQPPTRGSAAGGRDPGLPVVLAIRHRFDTLCA